MLRQLDCVLIVVYVKGEKLVPPEADIYIVLDKGDGLLFSAMKKA